MDQATGSSIVSILNLYVAPVTSVRRRSLICRIHASESCRNGTVRTCSRTSSSDASLPMKMTTSRKAPLQTVYTKLWMLYILILSSITILGVWVRLILCRRIYIYIYICIRQSQ
ncbi:hypothetical protein BDV23DRAFT_166941 [Aspergillus alliaceus]|uniref:Uncharacterized protein n=1 Tax=Petromyces alliaceus TaxID=209559 RepID=A0A5N7BS47_PETAA|nr:hypothetical protein BDV23DRAFT_166941 [Aspergillus alliaceus]